MADPLWANCPRPFPASNTTAVATARTVGSHGDRPSHRRRSARRPAHLNGQPAFSTIHHRHWPIHLFCEAMIAWCQPSWCFSTRSFVGLLTFLTTKVCKFAVQKWCYTPSWRSFLIKHSHFQCSRRTTPCQRVAGEPIFSWMLTTKWCLIQRCFVNVTMAM